MRQARDDGLIHTELSTPVGLLWIAGDQQGLKRIAFLYYRSRVPTPLRRKQAASAAAAPPSFLLRTTTRQLEDFVKALTRPSEP